MAENGRIGRGIGKGAGLGFWERRLFRGASLSGDVGVGCRPPIGGRGLIGTAFSGGAAAVVATAEAGGLRFGQVAIPSLIPGQRVHGSGGVGVMKMDSTRKRKPTKRDYGKVVRERQEEAPDDALKNTFPASDPVSIAQPVPPDTDGD